MKFQLNGGLQTEYGLPMRPGDVITSVNRLAEYRERQGRLGLMLLTVTEDEWTNQNASVSNAHGRRSSVTERDM